MGQDSFTEVTSQSWGSRLGGSIKGILVGLMIFIAAFLLLFWNEGRAVKRHKTLQEGGGAVVSVSSDSVSPGNEGKLVHTYGIATTDDILADEEFGVSANSLKLRRTVLMYQWEETSRSEEKKKLGGGTETTTTYSYDRVWSPKPISSAGFRKPDGHSNPGSMPYSSELKNAAAVTLGGYDLPPFISGRIDAYRPLPLGEAYEIPSVLGEKAKLEGGGIYIGESSSAPSTGDIRISFDTVEPTTVSVAARQVGNSLEAYHADAGGTIALLKTGTHSAASMFAAAEKENVTMTWILRVVGFLLMLAGLSMVFKPLSVLGDLVPFIGNLVGAGTGLVAFLLALSFSLITIGIAWVFYRPLFGVLLLGAGVGAVVALKKLSGSRSAPAGTAKAA